MLVWYVKRKQRNKGQPEKIVGGLLFPAWSLKVFDGEFQGLSESTGVAMGSGCGKYVAGGVIMFFLLIAAIVALTRHTWKGIKGSLAVFTPSNRKAVEEQEGDEESGCLPAFKRKHSKIQHWRMRGEWNAGDDSAVELIQSQKGSDTSGKPQTDDGNQVTALGANFGSGENGGVPQSLGNGQDGENQTTKMEEGSNTDQGQSGDQTSNMEAATKTNEQHSGDGGAERAQSNEADASKQTEEPGSSMSDKLKSGSQRAMVMARSASEKAMVKAKEASAKAKEAYENMDKTWVWRDFTDRFGGHFDSYYSYAWWWGSWEMVKKLLIGLVLGTVTSPTANGGLMLVIYMTELALLNFCAPFVDKWQMYMQFGSSCFRFINISCIVGYLNGTMSTTGVSQAFFVTALLGIMPLIVNSLVESLSLLSIQFSDAMDSAQSAKVAPAESVVVDGAVKAVEAGPEGGDDEDDSKKDQKSSKGAGQNHVVCCNSRIK